MQKTLLSKIGFVLFMLLAACSSSNNQTENQSQVPTPTPLPTLTTIPFFNFVQPTLPPQMQTIAAETAAPSNSGSSTPIPEPGRQIYVALECNTCHGEAGEGTDKGSALTSYTKSEEDFVSFLRSGGDVGTSHIYATDRLSDSDAKTLYEYVESMITG
jgi:mono/diheme cytochrome c family protein